MKFKKKLTIVGGRKVFYWEANKGYKKTLVLLHGFPGNHKMVIDMARYLGNYRIIVPDLPACGQSESLNEEHVLNNYSKWLDNFLKNIFVDNPIVIGYSFGSRVALTFADVYPTKVKKLVLITPVVRADGLIARLASLEYEIAGKLPVFMQETWLKNKVYHGLSNMIIFKSASKKRKRHLIYNDTEEIKHLDPRANVELFKEFLFSKPISGGRKINLNTLIIAADKDEIATLNSVKDLEERFTNFQFKIVRNSGHIVVAERPRKVAGIISEWLR